MTLIFVLLYILFGAILAMLVACYIDDSFGSVLGTIVGWPVALLVLVASCIWIGASELIDTFKRQRKD